jgi:DegV family protein with EDD domain
LSIFFIQKGIKMIKIIADTTSVIEPEEAQNLGIVMIPQIIVFGDKSYRDDNEITTEEFLSKLRSSPALPKTAAPPPALYTPVFEQISKDHDSAIVICPSAKVSGTYRSASVAAQDYPDADIHIIDTYTIGPALGTLVYKAKQWADAGLDVSTILERLNFARKHNLIYFYVDTLEYLHKGGRIGTAQALVGSLLQVKPILIFKDGQVNPFETQRTKRKAMARIVELVKAQCPHNANSQLAIFQADAMEDALALRAEFSEFMSLDAIRITKLPPAIIVHAGPGVVAVSFFTEFPQD